MQIFANIDKKSQIFYKEMEENIFSLLNLFVCVYILYKTRVYGFQTTFSKRYIILEKTNKPVIWHLLEVIITFLKDLSKELLLHWNKVGSNCLKVHVI